MTEEEYKELFCKEKRIRRRMVIYVGTETHSLLKRVAGAFRKDYVTISSMADAIIWNHLQTNRDPLERLVLEDDARSPFFKRRMDDETDQSD